MNTITITGNLVHTPKLAQTQGGVAMLTFTVADNQRSRGEEQTSFFDCTMFRQRAEAIGQLQLAGGTKVAVCGKMQQRKYEKDGQKRTAWSVKLMGETVEMLRQFEGFSAFSGMEDVLGRLEDHVTAMKQVYDPSHPDANEEGYVTMPNVNTVTEMTNLIDATRSYEANVTAFNATKNMLLKGLEVGQ